MRRRRLTVSLRDDLLARHGDALLLLQARKAADGQEVLLVVLDGDAAAVGAERERLADSAETGAPRIEVLDRATYEAIERLTGAGLLHATAEGQTELVRSPRLADPAEAVRRQRLAQCTEWLAARNASCAWRCCWRRAVLPRRRCRR